MYSSPGQMAEKVEEYFAYIQGAWIEEPCTETGKMKRNWIRHPEPATITGLCLHLGFADLSSLYDYEKKDEFTHIIKRARLIVQKGYELNLHGDKVTGSIFALKNMGWKDKQETEHSGGMQLTWKEERTYEAPNQTNPGT